MLFVAGDPSGDRHAALLVLELKAKAPEIRVSALGGRGLKDIVDQFLFPLVDIGGFGFWEPLFSLPAFWRAKRLIRSLLDSKDPPALVVLVDFYGFNIHIARIAAARGIPVVYYISPQVWASRPGRVQKMRGLLRKMLVLFPFETALYEKAGVPVQFVGHPLLKRLPSPVEPSKPPTIGFLPGSRPAVIRRHLPLIQETLERLSQQFPSARFVLIRPSESDPALYQGLRRGCPALTITVDDNYDVRRHLTLVISVSGTAALENMLLGIPMVLFYKLSMLTYALAKRLVQIPYVGIPNILAGRLIVPELLQDACTPETLSNEASRLLSDEAARRTQREALLALRQTLEPAQAVSAVEQILAELPTLRAMA